MDNKGARSVARDLAIQFVIVTRVTYKPEVIEGLIQHVVGIDGASVGKHDVSNRAYRVRVPLPGVRPRLPSRVVRDIEEAVTDMDKWVLEKQVQVRSDVKEQFPWMESIGEFSEGLW